MGRADIVEERLACSACGHAAGLHSNEACEAIRCTCRVTQKMLAKRPRPATAATAIEEPVAAPAKRPAKRKRRSDAARDADTQAA